MSLIAPRETTNRLLALLFSILRRPAGKPTVGPDAFFFLMGCGGGSISVRGCQEWSIWVLVGSLGENQWK